MILGRLDQQSIILRTLIQQKPVWRLCFNWLRDMPKDLPVGRHNLDNQIVTADYSHSTVPDLVSKCILYSQSIAQIHYVVEGAQQISLVYNDSIGVGQNSKFCNVPSATPKLVVIQNPKDFMVILPGDSYYGRATAFGDNCLKKVVVYIPVQRIL